MVKQYAGRLHRDYHVKKVVWIYDYLDSNIESAMIMKMYDRRSKGYRSIGYEIIEDKEVLIWYYRMNRQDFFMICGFHY